MDERAGILSLMDHLTALGHRKFAIISGPQRYSGAFSRHRYIMREMTYRGMEICPSLIKTCRNYSASEGIRCCEEILESGNPFTAIMTANDLLAIGCLQALARHGINCPEQVSVVGYKDIGLGDKTAPSLTTIRFGNDEPGIALANILLDRLKNPEAAVHSQDIKPTLLVRGSTAEAPVPFTPPKRPAEQISVAPAKIVQN
jgi:LacI family transcriptional regulator